jgi:hypothetical protein
MLSTGGKRGGIGTRLGPVTAAQLSAADVARKNC